MRIYCLSWWMVQVWSEQRLLCSTKSLLLNVWLQVCAQLGRIFKSSCLFSAFPKLETQQARLSGEFIKDTNPGAGSLIFNWGLIYRHWQFPVWFYRDMSTVLLDCLDTKHFWNARINLSFSVSEAVPQTVNHRFILWTQTLNTDNKIWINKITKDTVLNCVVEFPKKWKLH